MLAHHAYGTCGWQCPKCDQIYYQPQCARTMLCQPAKANIVSLLASNFIQDTHIVPPYASRLPSIKRDVHHENNTPSVFNEQHFAARIPSYVMYGDGMVCVFFNFTLNPTPRLCFPFLSKRKYLYIFYSAYIRTQQRNHNSNTFDVYTKRTHIQYAVVKMRISDSITTTCSSNIQIWYSLNIRTKKKMRLALTSQSRKVSMPFHVQIFSLITQTFVSKIGFYFFSNWCTSIVIIIWSPFIHAIHVVSTLLHIANNATARSYRD